MNVTLAPAAPVPALSTSMVISASSARLASLMTTAVAAVALVFSPGSMVSFVERIGVPLSLLSQVGAPELEAVVSDAAKAVMGAARKSGASEGGKKVGRSGENQVA